MSIATEEMPARIRRKEMATLLGVSVRTMDEWRRVGLYGVRLRAHKIGRTVGFTWADVDAFKRMVEKRRGQGTKSGPRKAS